MVWYGMVWYGMVWFVIERLDFMNTNIIKSEMQKALLHKQMKIQPATKPYLLPDPATSSLTSYHTSEKSQYHQAYYTYTKLMLVLKNAELAKVNGGFSDRSLQHVECTDS